MMSYRNLYITFTAELLIFFQELFLYYLREQLEEIKASDRAELFIIDIIL